MSHPKTVYLTYPDRLCRYIAHRIAHTLQETYGYHVILSAWDRPSQSLPEAFDSIISSQHFIFLTTWTALRAHSNINLLWDYLECAYYSGRQCHWIVPYDFSWGISNIHDGHRMPKRDWLQYRVVHDDFDIGIYILHVHMKGDELFETPPSIDSTSPKIVEPTSEQHNAEYQFNLGEQRQFLAEIYNRSFNPETKSHYERAIELFPEYAEVYYQMTYSYHTLSNKKGRKELLDKAIQFDPTCARYYARRAIIQKRLQSYESALEDINQAIQLRPECTTYIWDRAEIYHQSGEYEKAIVDYDDVLASGYDNEYAITRIINRRTVAYLQLQNYERVIEDTTSALDMYPNYRGYFLRACAYLELHQFDLALADIDKAIEIHGPSSFQKKRDEILQRQADFEG